MQALRPQLLSWSAKVCSFRHDGCHYSADARRAMLDVLYGEFVQMFWVAADPRDFIKRRNRRPQPDWWDDECYDRMVSRNAAWHCWCRERTSESREIFRSKRLEFHHLVRRKKAAFWHAWLEMQDRVSPANPRIAARNIRRQFGPTRRPLPISMRCHASRNGTMEGAACLDACRCHFRDVPSSVGASSSNSQGLHADVFRLRRTMSATATTSSLDFAFSQPELQRVLQDLPADRAPGPDGLTYEVLRVDDDALQSALLALFELVRYWAVVPSSWRAATVRPLHKSGPADEFTNYRPISLLSCAPKVFERLLLKGLHPRVDPIIDGSQAGFRWGAEEQIYTLAETLRLRARKRTFCGFVDVRKAFDVAWRDAVLVKLAAAGVAGSTWCVLDDLLSSASARVLINGNLSEPWTECAGVRQGSVLGRLLFNILFDGVATAVRAACPGVALGNDSLCPKGFSASVCR